MECRSVNPRLRRLLCLWCWLFLAGSVGCEQDSIQAYDAPKDAAAPGLAVVGAAAAPDPVVAQQVEWKIPEGWRQVPGEKPMRVATFEVVNSSSPVEIAVSAFPGDVGGMLANVNRWRGQLGLPALERLEDQPLKEIGNPEGPGVVVIDLTAPESDGGGEPQRAVIATLTTPDTTWFIKMTGLKSAVGKEAETFERFVVANTGRFIAP